VCRVALPSLRAGVGASLGGAVMVAVAPRPTREPVIAGVLMIGLMVVLFVLCFPESDWIVARSAHPVPVALALAALSAACAFGGARLGRRVERELASPRAIV